MKWFHEHFTGYGTKRPIEPTVLDRSHSKLNSWLGLSGANDSSDVKLVHFLLFVAMDSRESISRISYTRREKFVGSETIVRSFLPLFSYREEFWTLKKRLHEQCARALTCVVTRDIQQMSVYRGKTMNRGVRTCVRANAWPGVGVSQTRMWILVAHPYDKVRSPYCFPSRKWYLKPFAKTSPTGLSPYSRGYIAYVHTRQYLCFPFFLRRLCHLPVDGKTSIEKNVKFAKKETIILFMKLRNVHVKTWEKQNSISAVLFCALDEHRKLKKWMREQRRNINASTVRIYLEVTQTTPSTTGVRLIQNWLLNHDTKSRRWFE